MPQQLDNLTVPGAEATQFPAGNNSGTVTLIAGTRTVAFLRLTALSRIYLQLRTANTVSLTVQYIATLPSNGVGFTVQANVAAGTINVADISTLDWFVVP